MTDNADPALLVHLEDPPGSGLMACSGAPFERVVDDQFRHVPRQLCPDCRNACLRSVNPPSRG